jgi:hypothetical protein
VYLILNSSRVKFSLIIALLLAGLALSSAALAQQPGQKTVTTIQEPPPAKEQAPDYSQEALVIEQMKLGTDLKRMGVEYASRAFVLASKLTPQSNNLANLFFPTARPMRRSISTSFACENPMGA